MSPLALLQPLLVTETGATRHRGRAIGSPLVRHSARRSVAGPWTNAIVRVVPLPLEQGGGRAKVSSGAGG